MSANNFIPQNLLEKQLVDAISDPSARPKFMESLLGSEVLIVPIGPKPTIVNGMLPKEATIQLAAIEHEGRQYTPFFTSEARLIPGTEYLQLRVRDFFEFTKGAYLVMNPGSAYGKEFIPSEVSALLDGSFFRPSDTRVVQENTPVMIGQPAKYPNELVSTLSRLYARTPAVKQAFLAQYHDPKRDAEPGLVIVLDVDSEAALQRLSAETGLVIEGVSKTHKYIDVTRFDTKGLGSYFIKNKISPFYKRSLLRGILRKFAG
jgi:hypothetical protein